MPTRLTHTYKQHELPWNVSKYVIEWWLSSHPMSKNVCKHIWDNYHSINNTLLQHWCNNYTLIFLSSKIQMKYLLSHKQKTLSDAGLITSYQITYTRRRYFHENQLAHQFDWVRFNEMFLYECIFKWGNKELIVKIVRY